MSTLQPRGKLDTESLERLVTQEQIDTVLAVFPDIYGRLMGKRITGRFFVDTVLQEALHACEYLLACDMEMEPVPGYAFTSWASGYGDFRLRPDLQTLRHATWLDKTAIVLCDVYEAEREELVQIAPRSMLQEQVARAAAQGYVAMGGSELEFYLFKDSYEDAANKKYIDLQPFVAYIED